MTTIVDNKPTIQQGWETLDAFNIFAPLWLKMYGRKKYDVLRTFNRIFGNETSLSKHLAAKYLGYKPAGFAGFFLNVDYKNQQKILNDMFPEEVRLEFTYPDIEGWEALGKKYGMDKWPEYDMEDVRGICVGFGDRSKWECYPAALVWINKFLLYANNHSISEKEYPNFKGDRFGNFKNWNHLWKSLGIYSFEQKQLVEQLLNYK